LLEFEQLLLSRRPQRIIGLAHLGRRTQLEAFAINRFNSGIISKLGAERYSLNIPGETDIHVNTEPYTSYCNWVAYNVEELVVRYEVETRHSFLHFHKTTSTTTLLTKLELVSNAENITP
jgi:hypothetical protein